MTQVMAQMSVSLDGFYAGPRDPRDPQGMDRWLHGPEAPGFFRVTRWATDAMGWRAPVFVVTHRPGRCSSAAGARRSRS